MILVLMLLVFSSKFLIYRGFIWKITKFMALIAEVTRLLNP